LRIASAVAACTSKMLSKMQGCRKCAPSGLPSERRSGVPLLGASDVRYEEQPPSQCDRLPTEPCTQTSVRRRLRPTLLCCRCRCRLSSSSSVSSVSLFLRQTDPFNFYDSSAATSSACPPCVPAGRQNACLASSRSSPITFCQASHAARYIGGRQKDRRRRFDSLACSRYRRGRASDPHVTLPRRARSSYRYVCLGRPPHT
jgi:hypothetical protein